VVAARYQARDIAARLGFDSNDQTRIATAVSEIARNAFQYASAAQAEFLLDSEGSLYTICITDKGPGIAELNRILDGDYDSRTGMGMGIVGARRLMDQFQIESESGKGTVVTLAKRLPGRAPFLNQRLSKIAQELSQARPRDVLEELRSENQELLRVLNELRARQDDLISLNAELEDTNRGVVALYAELDEKAERLRRADQVKSRFLSHVSHEFRTPLTSILALSRLLLDESDGPLTPEQCKQVKFIRRSAENLLEMVNDLLDLARVEAGKSVVRPSEFHVSNLFGALRGVLRPLQVNEGVELIFEDPAAIPQLYTDESKVAQILRNFISNALKFTERGEVRVWAQPGGNGDSVIFSVSDTGIGIDPKNLELIFEEFSQIETPIQRKLKGTGLGLPLTKCLAEVLGGRVWVESAPGRGSTFSAEIPIMYKGEDLALPAEKSECHLLIIDDEEVSRYLIRQTLGSLMTTAEAGDGPSGIDAARRLHPGAIMLDLRMPGMSGFEVLDELKQDPATCDIPVVIMTSKPLNSEDLDKLNARTVAVFSKEVLSRPDAGSHVRAVIEAKPPARTAERSDAVPHT
jgi:signal transduction histidine kinase/CheY-like chemotaxis protein